MYSLTYSTAFFLAFFILSHARRTVFISQNGEHSFLPSSSDPGVCMTPQCVISAADVLTSLDETVDPCDDFYKFACGGWMKRHELEEDQLEIDVTVEMTNDISRKLKELLESSYESSDPPFVKMLKDFYRTCIDLDNNEKNGSEPLIKILNHLGGLPVIEGKDWDGSTFDWVDTMISLRKLGYSHNTLLMLRLFPSWESGDEEPVPAIRLGEPELLEHRRLIQSANLTLGLDDPKIAGYFKLMVDVTELLGADESVAEKELLEVLNFTIALENCTIPKKGLIFKRQPRFYSVKELQQKVPKIPWQKLLNGVFGREVIQNEKFYIYNLNYIIKLADLLTSTNKRTIANYMMIQVVLESSVYLPGEWSSVRKNVLKLLEEEEEMISKPRWKNCLSTLTEEMTIALSSYYVRYYFNEENKDEAMILMKYIQKEFLKILEESDWMDENTRKKAEEKANAIKSYIGYPKELLNDTFVMKMYENLTITSDSYLENILALHKMTTDYDLSLFGKSDIRENIENKPEFEFTLKVNALYDENRNVIVIPAGILHDAFYVKDRPNYLNFAAIGSVIGHEITHGFDNQGRNYDKDGKRKRWWDEDSDRHFVKKVQCIIDQYDNYTTDIGMKVNGESTQNENIADNGGLKEAYRAYQSWTEDNGIEPTLPGVNYTQNQLFWVSTAHTWCVKYQPKQLEEMLLTDPHSPGQFRVIGPVSNLKEFSNDFKCSADSPMNRKYKCKVW